jgi:hypothetical protein
MQSAFRKKAGNRVLASKSHRSMRFVQLPKLHEIARIGPAVGERKTPKTAQNCTKPGERALRTNSCGFCLNKKKHE